MLNVEDLLRVAGTTSVVVFTLSGGVGTLKLDIFVPYRDIPAVDLPEDVVDLLEVEGVGDNLIAGKDIL